MTDEEFNEYGKAFPRPVCQKCGEGVEIVYRVNRKGCTPGVFWCLNCCRNFTFISGRDDCP